MKQIAKNRKFQKKNLKNSKNAEKVNLFGHCQGGAIRISKKNQFLGPWGPKNEYLGPLAPPMGPKTTQIDTNSDTN